jgi:hypothetical protein
MDGSRPCLRRLKRALLVAATLGAFAGGCTSDGNGSAATTRPDTTTTVGPTTTEATTTTLTRSHRRPLPPSHSRPVLRHLRTAIGPT